MYCNVADAELGKYVGFLYLEFLSSWLPESVVSVRPKCVKEVIPKVPLSVYLFFMLTLSIWGLFTLRYWVIYTSLLAKRWLSYDYVSYESVSTSAKISTSVKISISAKISMAAKVSTVVEWLLYYIGNRICAPWSNVYSPDSCYYFGSTVTLYKQLFYLILSY